jgi:phosphatidate cytidylyltransferase
MMYTKWLTLLVTQFIMSPTYIVKRSMVDEMLHKETLLQLIFFKYHFLISFCLVMVLVIFMVINLVRFGNFQYQIKTWGKAGLLALIFCMCCSSYIYATYHGYFWFIFSILAVAINDIMAYVFGMLFGRTPLIKLSPKKTWEGFVGGIIGTFVWCFVTSGLLTTNKFMVCP